MRQLTIDADSTSSYVSMSTNGVFRRSLYHLSPVVLETFSSPPGGMRGTASGCSRLSGPLACLRNHFTVPTSPTRISMLPAAMARSSSDGVAIRCVLPVLWITFSYSGLCGSSCVGTSATAETIVAILLKCRPTSLQVNQGNPRWQTSPPVHNPRVGCLLILVVQHNFGGIDAQYLAYTSSSGA